VLVWSPPPFDDVRTPQPALEQQEISLRIKNIEPNVVYERRHVIVVLSVERSAFTGAGS